jgi:hypothetical protein
MPIPYTVNVESPGLCCTCGVVFAMPSDLISSRKRDGKQYFCPNGHPQLFSKTEAERLQEELDQVKKKLEYRDNTIDSLRSSAEAHYKSMSAKQGVITKKDMQIERLKAKLLAITKHQK